MRTITDRLLYWAPRVLGLLFAGFISLFALDVFGEGYTPGELVIALTMHLVPTMLLLLCLALAWHWEWTAALTFLGLAAVHVVWSRGRFDWPAYLLIDGPLVLLACLFLADWWHRHPRGASTPLPAH